MKITVETKSLKAEIELKDPSLIDKYQTDPAYVSAVLDAKLTEAEGDILAPYELRSAFHKVNSFCSAKKAELVGGSS